MLILKIDLLCCRVNFKAKHKLAFNNSEKHRHSNDNDNDNEYDLLNINFIQLVNYF